MYYLLIDSHGSSLEVFADRDEAVHAWEELVRGDREATEDVALLVCEDDGTAVERIDVAEGQAGAVPF